MYLIPTGQRQLRKAVVGAKKKKSKQNEAFPHLLNPDLLPLIYVLRNTVFTYEVHPITSNCIIFFS